MNRRILIVFDKPHRQESFLDELRRAGCVVDVASDWAMALRLGDAGTYDAALIDDRVDGEHGADLYREIDRHSGRIKGILCSPNPTLRVADAAARAGMAHVVATPLDADEVLSLLDGDIEESSRPYDRRFPSAPIGFETEGDMVKGAKLFWCDTCDRPTHWSHRSLRRYFCCQDCLVRYHSLHDFSACSAKA